MNRIKRNEGWAQPAGARKEHFFRDGRSLCGNWGFFGTTEPNPPPKQYTCAKCERDAASCVPSENCLQEKP